MLETSWLQPLNAPDWRQAAEAVFMQPDDPILGLYLDGHAWALPWWVMKNHHAANLVLNGQPVLATLCEVCSGAAAFSRVVKGQERTFRLRGIHNGTHFLTDVEAGEWWGSFTGEALGRDAAENLTRLPLIQCRWREWLEMYPQTLVAFEAAEMRLGHGASPWPGSPELGDGFRASMERPFDRRMPFNALVLGVTSNGAARAYTLDGLDQTGAVWSDCLNGQELVILHRPQTWWALAFARELDGRLLTFTQTPDGHITDTETGSWWDYLGIAYAGPLSGRQLTFIPSGVEEWYVWAAYHADTDISRAV